MSLYGVNVDAVALAAATAKSIIEIATPSTSRCWIKEWWIDFDGVTASAVPVLCEIGRFSAGVTTATGATPDTWNTGPASLMTCKVSTTVEGAGTRTAHSGWLKRIPPTSGFHYVAPEGRELLLPISAFFRIRLTAAAIVNATCGVIWLE
jgi:hypothetical protein